MMRRTLLILILCLSGLSAWLSIRTANSMAEKVNHIYDQPRVMDLFMAQTPPGEIVRTASAFKFDRGAVQTLAVVNTAVFALAALAIASQWRKRGAQQPPAGDRLKAPPEE